MKISFNAETKRGVLEFNQKTQDPNLGQRVGVSSNGFIMVDQILFCVDTISGDYVQMTEEMKEIFKIQLNYILCGQ